MTLISLLIILFLEYQFKFSRVLSERYGAHTLLPGWYRLVARNLDSAGAIWIYLSVIAIPVLLVVWLTAMDSDFLFSVIQFFLILLILSYSLGPIDQNIHLKAYFEALERNDLQAAFLVVQQKLNQKHCQEAPDSIDTLGRQVTELILRQCNFRLFGVLFYFVIFGVGGALMYNLVCNLEYHVRDDETSKIRAVAGKVRAYVDWLPQRLTALLYSLAGDFNGAFARFLPFAFRGVNNSAGMLEETGIGAMGIDYDNRELDILTENKQALALVSRSTKVFILIIAIMTVFGLLA